LVQSEWYTQQASSTTFTYDYNKMMAGTPDEVVFNGAANQYMDHPLSVKAGQLVRLYVLDAGPEEWSAFHVIGGIFQVVYADGTTADAEHGVSTYTIAPGEGVVFDITFSAPGKYTFVDHNMRDMVMGAAGAINVTK